MPRWPHYAPFTFACPYCGGAGLLLRKSVVCRWCKKVWDERYFGAKITGLADGLMLFLKIFLLLGLLGVALMFLLAWVLHWLGLTDTAAVAIGFVASFGYLPKLAFTRHPLAQ